MKVVFADLGDMIQELQEKEISEVRAEPLYDVKYTEKHGVPFMKIYVNVHALLGDGLYCECKKMIYSGIQPVPDDKVKEKFDKNRSQYKAVKERLEGAGFTVRTGHFEE